MMTLGQRRRRHSVIALASGLVVLAVLPVSGVVAWRALRDSKAARKVITLPSIALPTTPTAILAVIDEQNFLTSLNLLALLPNGAGGTVMNIPVGYAIGGQPVGKPKRLADVYGSDGVEALKSAVEDLTNSQIDLISVNGQDGTAELIARVGTVRAEFTTPVTDTSGDANEILSTSGSHSFSPIETAAVLAARDVAQTEAERLPNIEVTWDAIGAAVGTGRGGAVPAEVIAGVGAQVPPDMPAFMSALFAGPLQVWHLQYERITDAKRNPQDIDAYSYNPGEIVTVMASIAPSTMVPVFPTLSIQLDSPFNDFAVMSAATRSLLYMGTNVILARTVDTAPPPVTVIRYSDETDRALAESLTVMFGEIVFEKATQRIAGIDVSVVIGDSFVKFLTEGQNIDPNTIPQDSVARSSQAPPIETTP